MGKYDVLFEEQPPPTQEGKYSELFNFSPPQPKEREPVVGGRGIYAPAYPPDVEETLASPEARQHLEALGGALGEFAKQQLEPQPVEEAAMGPALAPIVDRLKGALRAAEAYRAGAPQEQVQSLLSPEYGLIQQARQAQSPEEFYRAAVPLGAEGLQFASLALPFMFRGAVPPVVPRVPTGPPPLPILATIPERFAPAQAPQNLAEAIARARVTKIQQALAVEQARQQALPGTPPVQEPLQGPAPPADPLAAVAWHQDLMRQMQELAAQRALFPNNPIIERRVAEINQQLARGFQPPPENRFVIPQAREIPGAPSVPQVVPAAIARPAPAAPVSPVAALQPAPSVQTAGPPTNALQSPLIVPPQDVRFAGQGAQPPATPGIANRVIGQEMAAGQLPLDALVQGQGTTPAKAMAAARAELAADSGAGFKAARRVTAGKMLPGDPSRLHAYNDALAEAAAQARKAQIANPTDPQLAQAADMAEGARLDFLKNVLPKAKGMAQQTLVGFQGAEPADLATFTGMMKELQDFNGGNPLDRAQRMQLYKREAQGTRLKAAQRTALDRQEQAIEQAAPGAKIPTKAEMQTAMDKFIEAATPCQ